MCLQGISRASVSSSNASLQTAQCDSVVTWLSSILMTGIDSIAAFEAGGWSNRPTPFSNWVNWWSNRSKPEPIKKSDMLEGSGRRPSPAPSS
jgi:hypothetical protein